MKKTSRLESNVQDLQNLSEQDLKAMKKAQLKEVLKAISLPHSGNRQELLDRVLHHLQNKSIESWGEEPRNASKIGIDGSTSKKSKKWRRSDPAHISPYCYHRDVFGANFPLVDIVEVPDGEPFPVRDKFEPDVLDKKQTFEARRKWLSRFLQVEQVYAMAETEREAFPKHFALLEALWQFTNPTNKEVRSHNNMCRESKRKWSYEELKTGRKRQKVHDEENEGFYIVPEIVEVQGPLAASRSDGDNEGLVLSLEKNATLTCDLEENADGATGFADGVLHVLDKRPMKRTNPNSNVLFNADRVACILERKFLDDAHKWNARFQGGYYAVKHCLLNLRNGHGTPIYILIMTSSLWSYGILVPEGYVQIRNGEVDIKSMPEFEEHQRMCGVSSRRFDDLQVQLKKGTEFYQKIFQDNPQAIYADNPMLVGKYYLSSEWLKLPQGERGYGNTADVCRLFDGLVRVVLGDSVCDMQAEDFQQRQKLRKQMVKEREYSMMGVTDVP